jgi:hypothetical protein
MYSRPRCQGWILYSCRSGSTRIAAQIQQHIAKSHGCSDTHGERRRVVTAHNENSKDAKDVKSTGTVPVPVKRHRWSRDTHRKDCGCVGGLGWFGIVVRFVLCDPCARVSRVCRVCVPWRGCLDPGPSARPPTFRRGSACVPVTVTVTRCTRAALCETAVSRSVLPHVPRRHQLTVEKVVPDTRDCLISTGPADHHN